MAWNAPITWTFEQTVTSAQLNAQLSQNMLETAPAKAVGGAWPKLFTVAATNSIQPREIRDDVISSAQSTPSTSYVDLGTVGPQVTLTTGAFALCFPTAQCANSTSNVSLASFAITGASSVAAGDTAAVQQQGTDNVRASAAVLRSLTAGSNVFTMKYRVSAASTGTFNDRYIAVMGL